MSDGGPATRFENPSEPSLVTAMRRPDFYPHHPDRVELRQTHISWVFLAGDLVYKVKKPVRFSFLDYSTLARRHYFCHEEVRLNRRLAPSVYLGVVPIIESGPASGPTFVLHQADDQIVEPIEYAVEMRRLPEDRMLDRLLREGKAGEEAIHAISRKLVDFHAGAASQKASLYGTPEMISMALRDNVRETERFVGLTISKDDAETLRDYGQSFIEIHRTSLEDRIRSGKIRDGHGDLRAEHICLGDQLDIFDSIEFSERLRTCDVASDIGFLAMDLDFLGFPSLAGELERSYAASTRDATFVLLSPFYKCYRACVRGKVASLRSAETEVPTAEREDAKREARRYFQLALRYASGPPRAAIIAVCGLAGTGKSTVARRLGDRTGFTVVNSDAVRKRLAGIRPTTRVSDAYRGGIYSPSFTELAYSALRLEAKRHLARGQGVIIDATLRSVKHRLLFRSLADELHVPLLFIECLAEECEVFRRLDERARRADEVSDATREVYLRQRQEFAPLAEIPASSHLRLRSEMDVEEALETVERILRGRATDAGLASTHSR